MLQFYFGDHYNWNRLPRLSVTTDWPFKLLNGYDTENEYKVNTHKNTLFDRILTSDKEYIGYLNIPGYSEDNITITVEDGILKVEGKLKLEVPEGYKVKQVYTKEEDTLEMQYRLNDVDVTKIEASVTNGVLEIKMPFKQKEVKKIPITTK